jgi:uncharacterized oxidoreductase
LLPFGLHKGAGLALICSLLGAALTGSPTERHAKPNLKRTINGMLSIVLDPGALGAGEAYSDEVEALLDWVRQSRPDDGHLLFPGEPELQQLVTNQQRGIVIDDVTWDEILALRDLI